MASRRSTKTGVVFSRGRIGANAARPGGGRQQGTGDDTDVETACTQVADSRDGATGGGGRHDDRQAGAGTKARVVTGIGRLGDDVEMAGLRGRLPAADRRHFPYRFRKAKLRRIDDWL